MKRLKIQHKFLIMGVILIAVFNPLAVVLWADGMSVALEFLKDGLVEISNYTVAIGATLVVVGLILMHSNKTAKSNKKLAKLKNTSKGGMQYE